MEPSRAPNASKDSVKKEGGSKGGGDAKKRAHHSSSTGSGKVVKREAGAKVKDEGNGALPKEKRKPGQKYSTPSPGQADRVFYETLLKQKPESHMAQDWCLAYGVCGAAEAELLYKTVCKRKGVQPGSSAPPLATSPTNKARKSSGGGSSRPRSSLPKDIEADTGFGVSSAFEGVGTTGF